MPATLLKPIPSAPGYFAGSDGEIYGPRGPLRHHGKRYARVWMYNHMRSIHRLVCEAFHGEPPSPKHHAAHGDGDMGNNRPENIRWATPAENCADRRRHGTDPIGERNPRARLTAEQVREIRATYANAGKYIKRGTRAALAKKFGVPVGSIKDVAYGRSWRHI